METKRKGTTAAPPAGPPCPVGELLRPPAAPGDHGIGGQRPGLPALTDGPSGRQRPPVPLAAALREEPTERRTAAAPRAGVATRHSSRPPARTAAERENIEIVMENIGGYWTTTEERISDFTRQIIEEETSGGKVIGFTPFLLQRYLSRACNIRPVKPCQGPSSGRKGDSYNRPNLTGFDGK